MKCQISSTKFQINHNDQNFKQAATSLEFVICDLGFTSGGS
jgi:hypothetical protein